MRDAAAPARENTATSEQTSLEQFPKLQAIAAMAAYLILLNAILAYLLIKLWPGTLPLANRSIVSLGWGGRLPVELWIETRYLLIVAIAGAIGSYIHLATSFADFVGNRKLKTSWNIWYLLRPFIGSSLAIVVYFVLRGGLTSGVTEVGSQMSPFGIAAISGMCGLFSKQATDKLQAVFEEAFRTKTAARRADPLSPEPDTGAQHNPARHRE